MEKEDAIIRDRFKAGERGAKYWKLLQKKFGNDITFILGTGNADIDCALMQNINTSDQVVFLTSAENISIDIPPAKKIMPYHISKEEENALLSYYTCLRIEDKFICFNLCKPYGQLSKKIIDTIDVTAEEIAVRGLLWNTNYYDKDKRLGKETICGNEC
ncbi:MAG: hypothetical protein LUI60_08185 [Clostridia bacterium]|nr:hypothetical protein [Clostridia bacterium]